MSHLQQIDPPKPSSFDTRNPPSKELLADCVHCGFCLPACPTYVLWGEEMDSPRGRIYMMAKASQGEAPLDPTFRTHMDRCLGCMACMTACPSGVQYDKLIEDTRPQIERHIPRTLGDRLFRRLLFSTFPYPRRLRALAVLMLAYQRSGLQRLVRASGILRLLPARFAAMEALLPTVPDSLFHRLPTVTGPTIDALPTRSAPPQLEPPPTDSLNTFIPATAHPPHPATAQPSHPTTAQPPSAVAVHSATPSTQQRPLRLGILAGCVQQVFFQHVNEATLRVLAAEGHQVITPPAQGCCGALMVHSGVEPEARALARRTIATFEAADVDYIVINAAGCGSTMKSYGHILRDDPAWSVRAQRFAAKCRDISEILSAHPPRQPRHPLPLRVAYQDACHLRHAQGIHAEPRTLLASIPQLDIAEIAEANLCCGSAGVYNLLNPEPANQLGDRKVGHLLATEAQAVISANPGCLLQLQAGLRRRGLAELPTFHMVELLDASIRGLSAQDLLTNR